MVGRYRRGIGWLGLERTPVFFDPADYLEADPADASSEREAERLRREAEQRAKLCEATTRLAAGGELEAAPIHLAAREAGVGQGTYYKLYDSQEACVREAFGRCTDVVLAGVENAAAGAGGDLSERLEAGLGELLALLNSHPEVARLLLVEILAGDDRCREARERWLGRLGGVLACDGGTGGTPQRGSLAWLAAGAIASTLALWLDLDPAPPKVQMLEELVCVGSWTQGVDASTLLEGTTGEKEFEPIEPTARRRDSARSARWSSAGSLPLLATRSSVVADTRHLRV